MRHANRAVLVVSADAAVSEPIRWALEHFALDTIFATDAVEAVQRLSWDAPIAVVVDLRFPDIAANQVIRRAVACREVHGAPIVALCAHSDDSDALLDIGCAAVLLRDAPQSVAEAVSKLVMARDAVCTSA